LLTRNPTTTPDPRRASDSPEKPKLVYESPNPNGNSGAMRLAVYQR
jgi:hypothetical protein